MNITVQIDLNKMEINNFSELEIEIYNIGLKVSRELTKKILEERDLQLLAERDVNRYRAKGVQTTALKTIYGEVEISRRVYADNAAAEGVHYVHLLDQEIGIDTIGLVTPNLCTLIAKRVCETTYEATARQVSEMTGQYISKQGVWNITQKLGQKQRTLVERYQELSQIGKGPGCISTEILYEENDGVYLSLQGKSREKYGPSKEMKVGIAYDGTTYNVTKKGKRRGHLDNKVAYAGFVPSKKFKLEKEGIVASRFNVNSILLRVINGDGANWIQKKKGIECISVLDEYHRNKKITECVRDPEFASLLRELLFSNRFDELLDCIEAQINSIEDEKEIENLKELYSYYSNNREALPKYYNRDIEIPPTRDENIHHSRLGSMESNIFTLVSNRMKHGRKCWSIDGANNLALLLCARHTTGFEYLFSPLPKLIHDEAESDWADDTPISHRFINCDGNGYEYPHNMSTTNSPFFMRDLSTLRSLSDLILIN